MAKLAVYEVIWRMWWLEINHLATNDVFNMSREQVQLTSKLTQRDCVLRFYPSPHFVVFGCNLPAYGNWYQIYHNKVLRASEIQLDVHCFWNIKTSMRIIYWHQYSRVEDRVAFPSKLNTCSNFSSHLCLQNMIKQSSNEGKYSARILGDCLIAF